MIFCSVRCLKTYLTAQTLIVHCVWNIRKHKVLFDLQIIVSQSVNPSLKRLTSAFRESRTVHVLDYEAWGEVGLFSSKELHIRMSSHRSVSSILIFYGGFQNLWREEAGCCGVPHRMWVTSSSFLSLPSTDGCPLGRPYHWEFKKSNDLGGGEGISGRQVCASSSLRAWGPLLYLCIKSTYLLQCVFLYYIFKCPWHFA